MDALGINAANLIVQLIAFVVFLVIFWRVALGPVTNMLDQRRDRIRESVEAAERMQRELAATQARNEEILAEARREAQHILTTARESSEQFLARSREQAEQQAQEVIARAQSAIEAERQQAWQELRQDVADLAVAAAAKIVRRELNRQEHTRLIEETLAEVGNGRARSLE